MVTVFYANYQKLLAASTVVLAPAAADAAVMLVTGAPVSMSLASPVGATIPWDVDGTGNAEFELRRNFDSTPVRANTFYIDWIAFASDGPLNSRGFVET